MSATRRAIIGLAVVCLLLCALGIASGEQYIAPWLQRTWSYGALDDLRVRLELPSVRRVQVLLLIVAALSVAVIILSRVIERLLKTAAVAVRFGWGLVQKCWMEMAAWERWTFLTSLVACSVLRMYQAGTDPVMVDEALTWLFFSSKDPLAALTFYPAPNNHVLHTLLTSLTCLLPVDPLIALRIPVVLVALVAQGLLHMLLRRVAGPSAGLVATAFAISTPPFLYYGVFSRGYMLVILASVVAMAAAWLTARSADRRALHLLTIACIVGLWTVPSFLYAAAPIFLFVFWSARGNPLQRAVVLRMIIVMTTTTLLLYLPAFWLSGVHAFVGNPWVLPTGLEVVAHGWWEHFGSAFSWILGLPFGTQIVAGVVVGAMIATRGRDRSISGFATVMIVAALAIPFIHRLLPFDRTWIHLLVPIAMLIGLLLNKVTRTRPLALGWVVLAMGIYVLGLVRYRDGLPAVEYTAYHARTLSKALQDEPRKDILCGMPTSGVHLVFNLETHHLPYTYSMVERPEDLDARIATATYALVIVDRSHPLQRSSYRLVYEDGIQLMYRRMD